MKISILACSMLLVSTVAFAKPASSTCTGLSCATAKKAVNTYLGKLTGGWTITLSRYIDNVKQKKGIITVGADKKLAPSKYHWQAVSNRRVDQNYEEAGGPKLYRVFEGMVVKQKSGKVQAWRFPTFEEWEQTGGGF
jgi:hypothetical protein